MNESSLEKASLLSAGALLISVGTALAGKENIMSALFVVLGVACIALRELRKGQQTPQQPLQP